MASCKPQYGNGIKKTPLLGVLHALRKKIIRAQDGGTAYTTRGPVLGDFWPCSVKIGAKAVYYSDSH